MEETALQPERFSFSQEVPDEKSEELEQAVNKEKAIGNLYQHPDFPVYEQIVRDEIEKLRKLEGISIVGLSNEEIGMNFRAANLAADTVEKLLLKVKQSYEAKRTK